MTRLKLQKLAEKTIQKTRLDIYDILVSDFTESLEEAYLQGFEECLERAVQICERDATLIREQTPPRSIGRFMADACQSCANWIRAIQPKADEEK